MPVISSSDYKPQFWLKGRHLQTCWPSFRRKVEHPDPEETRIETPDGDFLDLYLNRCGETGGTGRRAVILCHGLEGHGRRTYILGMSRAFLEAGWDSLSWNFRSCGRELNRLPRMYHSGDTGDLSAVINHAVKLGYAELVLIGFSMGGNQVLKLLGEGGDGLLPEIKAGIGVSVPCDLTDSCISLSRGLNRLYTRNFLGTLKAKIKAKHERWPELFDISGLESITTFKEFDDRYTAPIHGFLSAEDYWYKSSCMHVLTELKRPVLIVNAKNDPFLVGRCFPIEEASANDSLWLEMPEAGGHVGFTSSGEHYWSEARAVEFAREHFFPLATY